MNCPNCPNDAHFVLVDEDGNFTPRRGLDPKHVFEAMAIAEDIQQGPPQSRPSHYECEACGFEVRPIDEDDLEIHLHYIGSQDPFRQWADTVPQPEALNDLQFDPLIEMVGTGATPWQAATSLGGVSELLFKEGYYIELESVEKALILAASGEFANRDPHDRSHCVGQYFDVKE
ncbi:MAG: hypothetical protein ABEN55_21120 [Bradymonadaceae bacterium]